MRINEVKVTYGQLRSTGYPAFSNTRHEITIGAILGPNDNPKEVREYLQALTKAKVRQAFGDPIEEQLEIPMPF